MQTLRWSWHGKRLVRSGRLWREDRGGGPRPAGRAALAARTQRGAPERSSPPIGARHWAAMARPWFPCWLGPRGDCLRRAWPGSKAEGDPEGAIAGGCQLAADPAPEGHVLSGRETEHPVHGCHRRPLCAGSGRSIYLDECSFRPNLRTQI